MALAGYRTRISAGSTEACCRTILIATILCPLFEQLQCNTDAIDQHMANGILLLQDNLGLYLGKGGNSRMTTLLDDEGLNEAEWYLVRTATWNILFPPLYPHITNHNIMQVVMCGRALASPFIMQSVRIWKPLVALFNLCRDLILPVLSSPRVWPNAVSYRRSDLPSGTRNFRVSSSRVGQSLDVQIKYHYQRYYPSILKPLFWEPRSSMSQRYVSSTPQDRCTTFIGRIVPRSCNSPGRLWKKRLHLCSITDFIATCFYTA
jgi:hypothetical protein